MKLLYVSGKYSGNVCENIHNARIVSIKLWEAGFAVITPHLNSAHMELDCKSTYDDFIAGDIEILRRCDAIIMLPDWQSSAGAVIERKKAIEFMIPVYDYPNLPENYD
jgi:hypothetical protein